MDKSLQVLEKIDSEDSYHQLIAQVNKDFNRAQCDIELSNTLLPKAVVTTLNATISNLLQKQPSRLNQLLYLIDLSEKNLAAVSFENKTRAAQQLSYFILKREWQKVYLSSIHSSQQ